MTGRYYSCEKENPGCTYSLPTCEKEHYYCPYSSRIALAQQLVDSPQWKGDPGISDIPGMSANLPDLTDAATVGCLEEMLWEAEGCYNLTIKSYRSPEGKWACDVVGPTGTKIIKIGYSKGEAVALALLQVWADNTVR